VISGCSGGIARDRNRHAAAQRSQVRRRPPGRKRAQHAQTLTARTVCKDEGNQQASPPHTTPAWASAVRRPSMGLTAPREPSRMVAIRHEAWGTAREPGSGTSRRNAPWHYAALRCAQFPPRTKLQRMSQTTEHRPRSRSMKDSQPAPLTRPITSYPPGALVRSSDICRDPKRGYAGILPIDRSTWHRWVKSGKAPAGRCLAGTSTRVWEIEAVRRLGTSTP